MKSTFCTTIIMQKFDTMTSFIRNLIRNKLFTSYAETKLAKKNTFVKHITEPAT